jgi:amidohydrolase
MSSLQPQALLDRVNLTAATRSAHSAIIATRRHLHTIPEIGLEEHDTSSYISQRLTELGVPHQPCTPTGIAGLLDSGKGGPVVMLRADIDALPITEDLEHDYVSQRPGFMHACGHDFHAAMLLHTAQRFKAEGLAHGQLKLVFQPGEEGHHGASKMIAAGVMEQPHVDMAYGQHVWAQAPIGKIMIQEGPIMAAVDRLHVTIHGKGTHAAYPQGGQDPIFCAAQIITALQSVVSRNIDPLSPGVVTISMINAGTAHNIIPASCEMTGTVRVFDDQAHAIIRRRIHEICEGVAAALGCSAQVDYLPEHVATVNDPRIAAIVREEAHDIVGEENVVTRQQTMGAEDMSDFLKLVPGAYAFIGGANEAKGCIYPHHHPKFNIDEDALAIGSELMYRVAKRLLAG